MKVDHRTQYSTLELLMCINILKKMSFNPVSNSWNQIAKLSEHRIAYYRANMSSKLSAARVFTIEEHSEFKIKFNKKKMQEYIRTMPIVKMLMAAGVGIGRVYDI